MVIYVVEAFKPTIGVVIRYFVDAPLRKQDTPVIFCGNAACVVLSNYKLAYVVQSKMCNFSHTIGLLACLCFTGKDYVESTVPVLEFM